MKNITTLLIPLIFTLVACNEGSPQIDRQVIHDQVKQKGEDIVWALNNLNGDTLVRDFWVSDSTLFIIDGMRVQGYDQIHDIMMALPKRRKKHDVDVVSNEVYVLSDDAAMNVVQFEEEIMHLNDSISTGRGIWTAIYKYLGDDWKVVAVHESHPPESTN